ncbi:MAG: glucose/arabinose dehydrogenase, partial [Luteibaculaceae bacterium]
MLQKITFPALLTLIILLSSLNTTSQEFIRSELPTTIATPWEITYGPDHHLWLTEKNGVVSRVNPTTGAKQLVFTAPDYFAGDPVENNPDCPTRAIQHGTLGLSLHPDFLNSPFIYFTHSYNSQATLVEPKTAFKIRRLHWDPVSETVIGDTTIFENIPTGYDHLGGRLMAVKQNGKEYIYFSVGDLGISEDNSPDCYNPQSGNPNNFTMDPTTMNGKIHRINLDGTVPASNPIPGNSLFTMGHRNPQGLMFNTPLESMYDVEHGDRTDDEINQLIPGQNYGWKQVRGFYSDGNFPGEENFVNTYTPPASMPNTSIEDPLFSWCSTPPDSSAGYLDWCTIAPSDGVYYGTNGDIVAWRNSFLVVTLKDGAITDRSVHFIPLNGDGSVNQNSPKLDTNYFAGDQALNGRLRDIAISLDGSQIYLINNGGTDRDKITVYNYIPNSIDEFANAGISIGPNPFSDEIQISGSSLNVPSRVFN